MNSYTRMNKARDMAARIIAGTTNQTPVQAWAAVARECAKAESAFYAENPGVHGRRHQAFLANLDKLQWAANAQVETLGRAA
jgi:hypothetical protein